MNEDMKVGPIKGWFPEGGVEREVPRPEARRGAGGRRRRWKRSDVGRQHAEVEEATVKRFRSSRVEWRMMMSFQTGKDSYVCVSLEDNAITANRKE